jgi:hypothetical protein
MTLTQPPQNSPRDGRGEMGRRRAPRTPKGRQVDPQAREEIRALLGDRDRRRDLLIEHCADVKGSLAAGIDLIYETLPRYWSRQQSKIRLSIGRYLSATGRRRGR